jgi:glutamine amidotransferase PdxT
VIAGTFHPELAGEGRLHRYFLDIAYATRPRARAAAGR